MIKLKHGIFMLENNENNFPEEDKDQVYLKTETKGDDIREEIKNNATRIISVQIKSLKGHTEKLKENLDYVPKEANDTKLAQKEEKGPILDLKKRTKKILKLSTLKSFTRFNMQQLREEYDEALNSAKENGTTETIENLTSCVK